MTIERPLLILGAPRSGTTLLFSIFSSHPALWSLYREGEAIFKAYHHPADKDWQQGDRLDAQDASERIVHQIRQAFYRTALNYQTITPNRYSRVYSGRIMGAVERRLHRYLVAPLRKPPRIRLVEKTPKNCLRIPYLQRLFPDAFFLYIKRAPRSNINSLLNGWRTPRQYETYDVPGGLHIAGYGGKRWNFLLPEGWQSYAQGHTLAEVCAFQYRSANEAVLDNLQHMTADQHMSITYEDLVADAPRVVQGICQRVGLDYTGGLRAMCEELPRVNQSRPPSQAQQQQNQVDIQAVLPALRPLVARMGYEE